MHLTYRTLRRLLYAAVLESWKQKCWQGQKDLKKNWSLDGFELELHHLAPHNVAEVILPEAAEAREVVDQEFEAEPAPEGQQAHVDRHLAKARRGIVIVAAVVWP